MNTKSPARPRALLAASLLSLLLAASITALAASATELAGAGADDNSNGGAVGWANHANITADDDTFCLATVGSGAMTVYLSASDFGFAVPSGAAVNGVEVAIERQRSLAIDCQDVEVKLVKGGVVSGNNKADAGVNWPTALTVKTYGGASDLWGLALTDADVNASDFGVVLSVLNVGGGNSRPLVDYVSITVHYTTASGTPSATTMLVGGNR